MPVLLIEGTNAESDVALWPVGSSRSACRSRSTRVGDHMYVAPAAAAPQFAPEDCDENRDHVFRGPISPGPRATGTAAACKHRTFPRRRDARELTDAEIGKAAVQGLIHRQE